MNKYLIENYKNESDLPTKAIREGFGDGIVEAVKTDANVVVLSANLQESLKLEKLIEHHPNNYIQVGVAEQNMAGIATGLTRVGKVPFITSFAAFSPGVNFSQIRLACVAKQNIKVVSSHYSLSFYADGAAAQMEGDIGMIKTIPGMTIVSPADYTQAVEATKVIAQMSGPVYLRVAREKFPLFLRSNAPFEIGKAQQLLEGTDITIVASGSMVYEALQAASVLESDGISVDFLNIHTIKPLDEASILKSVQKTKKIVVVEEHNIWGGLGESIARVLSHKCPTPMRIIGVNDVFGESAKSHRELWQKYGLDRDAILSQARELLAA